MSTNRNAPAGTATYALNLTPTAVPNVFEAMAGPTAPEPAHVWLKFSEVPGLGAKQVIRVMRGGVRLRLALPAGSLPTAVRFERVDGPLPRNVPVDAAGSPFGNVVLSQDLVEFTNIPCRQPELGNQDTGKGFITYKFWITIKNAQGIDEIDPYTENEIPP